MTNFLASMAANTGLVAVALFVIFLVAGWLGRTLHNSIMSRFQDVAEGQRAIVEHLLGSAGGGACAGGGHCADHSGIAAELKAVAANERQTLQEIQKMEKRLTAHIGEVEGRLTRRLERIENGHG